jgi:hypothetical protein
MKNVQIIDGAENCTYDIYACTEDDFRKLFPGDRQDVEFSDDASKRLGEDELTEIFGRLWKSPIKKDLVSGIHGTLFFDLAEKKRYYPTKRSEEMIIVL